MTKVPFSWIVRTDNLVAQLILTDVWKREDSLSELLASSCLKPQDLGESSFEICRVS